MAVKIYVVLIEILLIIKLIDSKLRFVYEEDKSSSTSVIDCIRNFRTLLEKSAMMSDDVEINSFPIKIIKSLDISVTLIKFEERQPKGTTYIVFSSDVDFYRSLLKGITSEAYPLFIIVWTWADHTVKNNTLEKIFEIIWSRRIFSVMVLIENEHHDVNIYSHFPYRPQQCRSTGPPIHLDTWNGTRKAFTTGFFSDFIGLLKNFHLCPLRVVNKNRPPESVVIEEKGLLRIGGSGGGILMALMRKYNFTVSITQAEDLDRANYLRDKHGYVLSNYSKDLIIKAVSTDKFDLAFGVFPFVNHFSPKIEFSFFYLTEYFAFYVPCGTNHNPSIWRYYYVEFAPSIWGMIVALFFIFVLFMKMLSKLLPQDNSIFFSFWENIFIIWAIHIENIVTLQNKSNTAKVLFTMIMFYCMIISVAYRASLKSFLMARLENSTLQTWEELEESKFSISGLSQDFLILDSFGKTHPVLAKLAKKYETRTFGQFSDIVYDLSVKRNTAFFGSESMLKNFYANLHEEYGAAVQRVCQVGQYVATSPASPFLVKSGSPFRYMIDRLTIDEIETGHMQFARAAAFKTTSAYSLKENQEKFSFTHLKGTFLMLFFGMMIAFVVFVFEIIYFKFDSVRVIIL